MSHRTAAWLAWSLWALSLTLTALSLLLLVLNLSHPDVPVYSFWAENVLFSIGYSTVGAVLVPRMPAENPIGWLFCAIGLLWAVIHLIGEYAIYALLAEPGSLPAGELASWVYSWLWVPGLGLLVFLCLLFPNGRLPSARWRWFARLSATLDVGRSGFSGVLSRADRPRSPWHSQSAGDRGPAECLQAGASTHARSDSHLSSLAVAATGVRQGSRAPADQVVHLYCCGSGEWCHPPVHHL